MAVVVRPAGDGAGFAALASLPETFRINLIGDFVLLIGGLPVV